MSQDAAMRARVEGRDAVATRTMWQLTVGALRLRCVASATNNLGAAYVVEGRTSKGWKAISGGDDPRELLLRSAASIAVNRALRERGEEGR